MCVLLPFLPSHYIHTPHTGMCRLWNLTSMDAARWAAPEAEVALKTAIMPHTQSEGEKFKDVTSVTWSPDGQFLATGEYVWCTCMCDCI